MELLPTLRIACLLFILVSTRVSGQISFTGASGGNWGTASNWSGGAVPTAADDVTIPDGKDVTVNVAAVCKTLTIAGGGNNNAVTLGSNSLTVSGTLTINAPTTNNVVKQLNVQSGTLACNSVSMAATTANSRDCRLVCTTGTINVSGDIVMNGVALRNQVRINGNATTGGTLNLGGAISGGDFLSNNSNSTLNFNGTTAQTMPINADYIYNKITINNIAGVTLGGAITTTNTTDNITVQTGTFDNGGYAITGTAGKSFTVANGATLKISGTTSGAPTGFSTFSFGASSTVEYSGTGAQSVTAFASPGYGNLTITNASTKSAAAGLNVQGNLTVNTGATLALSSFTHGVSGSVSNSGTISMTTGTTSVTGNFTNSGTFTGGTTSTLTVTGAVANSGTLTAGTGTSAINVGGNWSNSGTFTCGASGTVTFNATASGRTISGTITGSLGKFNNLTFNGSGGAWSLSSVDIDKVLTITNGTLTASGTVAVAGTSALTVSSGGSLVLNNSASLLQTGYTGANTGTILVNRNTTPIILDDFTYWSSPTNGTQTLGDFSPLTQSDKFFSHASGSWSLLPTTTTFTPGTGYAIRSPETATGTPTVFPYQFSGIPNNGTINYAAGSIANQLIGNPYPSALNANSFIDANVVGTGTINQTITGTLYFWTHNHSLSSNNYLSTDYAVYTKLGGTSVPTGTGNMTAPTQYIASGQGFFVETLSVGSITFNNAMRTGSNNSNFYRNAAPQTATGRVWLTMTDEAANFSQILVGYVDGATVGYDPGYDGTCFPSEFLLYSLQDTNLLAVQARPTSLLFEDEVPLGYQLPTAGTTTISLSQSDGSLGDDTPVYLQDLTLAQVHNLKEGPYVFTSEAGSFANRFVLGYGEALGNTHPEMTKPRVSVVKVAGSLHLRSDNDMMDSYSVYDVAGRLVASKTGVSNNSIEVPLTSSHQALIVKVRLVSGIEVSKKVLF